MFGPLKKRRAASAVPDPAAEQPTSVMNPVPTPGPSADLGGVPAGLEPQPVVAPGAPSFRDRGRLRRRLRYLRRVRELGFRDLGGLVFDQHRFGREGPELVAGKLAALDSVDAELRALEVSLDDRPEFVDLREPGIAACPRCAGLHGSDARFCPSCGFRLGGPLSFAEVGEGPPRQIAEPTGLEDDTAQPLQAPATTEADAPQAAVAERSEVIGEGDDTVVVEHVEPPARPS